jgi:hypothetical protein
MLLFLPRITLTRTQFPFCRIGAPPLALIALAAGHQKSGALGPKTCEATTRHGRLCAGHDAVGRVERPETSSGEKH